MTKTLLLALLLISISARAEDISGVWYGVAPDTGGNPDFDHQTILAIATSPQTAASKITYIYPALGQTCRSNLTFDNLESSGSLPKVKRIWTFDDQTQSEGCLNGKVRITAAVNIYGQLNSIQFEWINPDGHVDNAGTLERVELPLP